MSKLHYNTLCINKFIQLITINSGICTTRFFGLAIWCVNKRDMVMIHLIFIRSSIQASYYLESKLECKYGLSDFLINGPIHHTSSSKSSIMKKTPVTEFLFPVGNNAH